MNTKNAWVTTKPATSEASKDFWKIVRPARKSVVEGTFNSQDGLKGVFMRANENHDFRRRAASTAGVSDIASQLDLVSIKL